MPAIFRRSILYAQNFLTSSCLVDALLDRCSFESSDILYEIGPGKGIITDRLPSRCSQVVALEKDAHLVEALRSRFDGVPNIIIHESDFLQFRLPNTHYKVFASIPFNITTAIVTKLTMAPCPPDDAYLVMQKEAADKFLGKPRESLYAVLMKPWFELDIIHRFRRSDFIPAPRVDVVMLRLRKRGPPLVRSADRQCFRDFVVHSFTTWQPGRTSSIESIFTRQQLRHLRGELGVDFDVTPTAIPFEHWLCLFEY